MPNNTGSSATGGHLVEKKSDMYPVFIQLMA